MIFGNYANLLCCLLVANCAIENINAIFFDEIFEYLLDGIDDSYESSSSEELTNITCKNCTLTVECTNCTHSDKIVQSTTPMQVEYSQQVSGKEPSPKPTPTIPAPERVVEIMANNIPKQGFATPSENIATTVPTQSADGQQLADNHKDEEQSRPLTSSADSTNEQISENAEDKVMDDPKSSDTDSNSNDDQSKITTKK